MSELRELTTDEEWDAAVPILRQLWSHREEAFVRSWREEDDYRLFGWYVADHGVGARGEVTDAASGGATDAGRGETTDADGDEATVVDDSSADRSDDGSDAGHNYDGADEHDGDDGTAEHSHDGGAELVAVAGVSIQRVLHHVRHCWIHDFVVDEPRRGEGHGAALLARLEEWACERDCEYVALACVADNDHAFAFYESQGLTEWGSILETEL